MNDVERIRAAVYRTIDAVNDLLPTAQGLQANDDFVFLGKKGLDSMGFVNFMVALEEELEREFGRDLNIADLLNMQADDSDPILMVGDLIKALSQRLG